MVCRASLSAFVLVSARILSAGEPASVGRAAISPVAPTRVSPASSVALAAVDAGVGSDRFGVLGPGEHVWGPEMLSALGDLGAACVRINVNLDGGGQGYTIFLAAGFNVVLTCANRDPGDVDTSYGSLQAWPNAGFPFVSKSAYQQRIHDLLSPALPYLVVGRQLWVQCENEVVDASFKSTARYWRGTADAYLRQLDALFEEVRAVSPSILVVASSFASETLDAGIEPAHVNHDAAVAWVTKVLAQGQYDAGDLHFYGCVDDIATKAMWVKSLLPKGKLWISTENSGPDSRCAGTPLTWDQNPTLFEQNQAQQVASRLSACTDNGGSLCLYFSLYDLLGEVAAFAHLGLLDPSWQPAREKPAYAAFKAFTSAHTWRVRRHLSCS